ncbi:hypothetical protein [Streptomyces sp. NPDC002328]|uniref:hypothetical protein n=1 Tax=Streptomyces sp. NPDC002328 TaxID=3364642 RepID=UPI0036757879
MHHNDVPRSRLRARQRSAATFGALALMLGGGITFAPSAAASGCSVVPPCGRVVNQSAVPIQVQITSTDIRSIANRGIGGWSERIDVDFYRIPARCSARVTASGPGDHPSGPVTRSGSREAWSPWYKLSSSQTVKVESISCSSQ